MDIDKRNLFITTIVFAAIIYEVWIYLKAKATEKWRHQKAIVKKVYVTTMEQKSYEYTSAKIVYEYSVYGITHESSNYGHSNFWSRCYKHSAGKVVGVNIGDEIDIYVNPRKPQQAVIERGYQGRLWPEIIGMLSILLWL